MDLEGRVLGMLHRGVAKAGSPGRRLGGPEALVGALIAVTVSGCLHGGHRVEISQ